MDMRKEIKLSDLFKRKPKQDDVEMETTDPTEPAEKKPSRFTLTRKKSEDAEPKEPKAPKEPRRKKSKKGAGPALADVPLMRAFNLMPKDAAPGGDNSRVNPVRLAIAVAALVVFALLASMFLIANARVADKQTELNAMKSQLAALDIPAQEPAAVPSDPSLVAERDSRTTALSSALGSRVQWDRFLRDISLVLPDDAWLTTMISSGGVPADQRGRLRPDRRAARGLEERHGAERLRPLGGERRDLAEPCAVDAPGRVGNARERDGDHLVQREARAVHDQRDAQAPGSSRVKKDQKIPMTPVLAVALVLVAALAWFLVVGPKQGRGGELDAEIADYEAKIMVAQQPKPEGPTVVQIEVADVFRLAKAMPDNEDMANVLLELNSVATSAGIEFVSIQPGPPANRNGYYAVPVTLTLEGNYYDLTDFLFRLRNLVTVTDGVLEANGRLYTLDTIEIHESSDGFPQIEAVLVISAYAYGAPEGEVAAAPAEAAPPPPPSGGTTVPATTTGQTTTGTAPPVTSTNNAMAPIPGAPGQPTPPPPSGTP